MGPCGWEIAGCACGGCLDDSKPATQELALTLAAHTMWVATGRRYGPCSITVLPCNPPRELPLYQVFPHYPGGYNPLSGYGPYIADGVWYNRCGYGFGGCSCRGSCEIELPGPVFAVDLVLVDGVEVDASAYRVYDREALGRIDGQCWPNCQTYGEVPGFEIGYRRGDAIPDPVLLGASILACEYAKACKNQACALPANLRSLTRQGLEVSVLPDDRALTGGKPGLIRTGIRLVDDIIAADNPYGMTDRPENSIWSPDMHRPRVITQEAAGS